ncbi:Aspartate racemase [uncultured archaeon]|nr:Aspartate racemase [uncultured archaeon]
MSGVKKLEAAGVDFIVIACNTVHAYYNEMQSAIKIPIFSIIDETKKMAAVQGVKKIGLFASETTVKLNLYQKSFFGAGIEVIPPNEEQQKVLNCVIEHVMGGNQDGEDIKALKEIAKNYKNQGAEAIVLGCTEIPLAINQSHTEIKLFDTLQILAEFAVDYALCGKKPVDSKIQSPSI